MKIQINDMKKPIKGKKEKKEIIKELEIPSDIALSVHQNEIIAKKDNHELKRKVENLIEAIVEGNKLILKTKITKKIGKRKIGALFGHVKNMIEGLREGYVYELEMCNVHFPMSITFDKAKKEIAVKNMLGEKTPRVLKISDKVEVEVKVPRITVKSYDLEAAGQTAADLEKITKIRNRDRNKFQDGIFITKKPGREKF